jgi:hypothetical protein
MKSRRGVDSESAFFTYSPPPPSPSSAPLPRFAKSR